MCNGNKENIISNIEEKDKKALLLGNGIFLSHPSKGDNFKFSFRELKDDLIKVYEEHYKCKDIDCPEELLSLFRVELSLEILKYYKKKFDDNYFLDKELSEIKAFVKPFKNIYTINYDPVTYRFIFGEEGTYFNDGFNGSGEKSIEEIEKNLKNDKDIYYLHGAFHIIKEYENDKYIKLKSSKNKLLMDVIKEKHEEIVKQWREGSAEYKENFSVVLAAEPHYKQITIERDPYLKFCKDQLSKENKVVSVGCSFKKDEHLLEAILLNPNLESFEIGVYDENDKKNVEDACERIEKRLTEKDKHIFKCNCNKERRKFVCTRDLDKLFWSNVPCPAKE